jgi:hypothetical protein
LARNPIFKALIVIVPGRLEPTLTDLGPIFLGRTIRKKVQRDREHTKKNSELHLAPGSDIRVMPAESVSDEALGYFNLKLSSDMAFGASTVNQTNGLAQRYRLGVSPGRRAP